MQSEEYAEQYLELLLQFRKQFIESLIQKPISGEEYVIEYLAEHPGQVYPSEISETMQTSSARVAVILRHLECISLILRGEDSNDARRRPVELSPAGIRRAKELHQKRVSTISSVFKAIGEEETKEFIRITTHMIRICEGSEANAEK